MCSGCKVYKKDTYSASLGHIAHWNKACCRDLAGWCWLNSHHLGSLLFSALRRYSRWMATYFNIHECLATSSWYLISSYHEGRVSRKWEGWEVNTVCWWDSQQGYISNAQAALSRSTGIRELELNPGTSALIHFSLGWINSVRCHCEALDQWFAQLYTFLPDSTFNKWTAESSKYCKSTCHNWYLNTYQNTTGQIISISDS